MLSNGGLLGIIITISAFMLFICIMLKKEKKDIDKVKEKMSKEDLEKIENANFYIYNDNNNFLVGTSYIYGIKEDTNRFEIKLIFSYDSFNKPGKEFMVNTVYMDKDTFKAKKLQVGQLVETLHNRSNDVLYRIKQIL